MLSVLLSIHRMINIILWIQLFYPVRRTTGLRLRMIESIL